MAVNNKIIVEGVKKINLYLVMGVTFIMPFGTILLSYFIGLWALASMLEGKWIKKASFNLRELHVRYIFILYVIFYIINIVGFLYSKNKANGFAELQIKFSILLIPLLFAFSNKLIHRNLKKILLSFITGVFIASIICYFIAFYNSLNFDDGKFSFIAHSPGSPWDSYFAYARLSFIIHPSYFSMYIVFSIAIILSSFFKNSVIPGVKSTTRILLIIFFTLTLFLISSRAGLFTWFAITILFFIKLFIKKVKLWQKWFALFLMILIIGLFINIVTKGNRFRTIKTELETVNHADEETHLASVALRLVVWKNAIRVIKKNPMFGVGTGNVEKKLYENLDDISLNQARKMNLNVHNQFLETWMEQGIFALFLLLAIMFYPVFSKKFPNSHLFIYLTIIIFINFLFESMLNRINGVAFFAFFYSLFAFLPLPGFIQVERSANGSTA